MPQVNRKHTKVGLQFMTLITYGSKISKPYENIFRDPQYFSS